MCRNRYFEFNDSVSGGSVGQDIGVAPQLGHNCEGSVWLRAPGEAAEGTLAVFGLKAGEAIGDAMTTRFTAGKTWQRISVPLTVTQSGEERIRVQVYETSPGRSLDLDGAEVY